MARKTTRARATMVEVARRAGVSQSCVSLVVNNVPDVRLAEETRDRVWAAVRELGYSLPGRKPRQRGPSSRASGFAPNVIAYFVDEVSLSPHPVLHMDGARDAAWASGCVLQIYVTRGDADLERECVARVSREPMLAGIIYATGFTRKVDLPDLPDTVPVVLVNCHADERSFPALLPGERAGGATMTGHLLAQGHRRIAMIGGEAWMEAAQDRLQGYREALATAGIGFDPALVVAGDWTAASGYRHALSLLRMAAPPTAVFCANDLMALGAMQALLENGCSVPADMSVVGYNDLELARHLRPSLTSCTVPNHELGARAAEMIMDTVLTGHVHRPAVSRLECRLVERASVAPPRPR